jgi:hypothetical protein
MHRLPDEQIARVLIIVATIRKIATDADITARQLDLAIDALEDELPIADLEALVYEVAERRADDLFAEKGIN